MVASTGRVLLRPRTRIVGAPSPVSPKGLSCVKFLLAPGQESSQLSSTWLFLAVPDHLARLYRIGRRFPAGPIYSQPPVGACILIIREICFFLRGGGGAASHLWAAPERRTVLGNCSTCGCKVAFSFSFIKLAANLECGETTGHSVPRARDSRNLLSSIRLGSL